MVFSQNKNSIQELKSKILKNQYDSAIIVANDIIKNDSLNWVVYYYLGKSYQNKYKYFDALKAFEKANLLDTTNLVIENALAETYEFIGKNEETIQIYYNQYLRDSSNIEPIARLANIFRKTREYGSAIHYYQKASAIDPENFYYYKQQGFCISKINMPVPAIYAYEMALMFNPYDLNVYVQLANLQNTERYFSEAIKTCNKGLLNYPEETQLLKLKAYAQYLNRDFDLAILGFNKLLEMGDTSFFNLKYRGLIFFKKKMYVSAVNDFTIAAEINNQDAELYFYLGSAFGRSNSNVESIFNLNKSLKLLSSSPTELTNIYSEMAFAYLNQKKYKLSLEYLKLAYKSDTKPILSFKMGQIYDYYLDNKKLAIDCYEAYLIMLNEPDISGVGDKSFLQDQAVINNTKERIRILKEDQFFERTKKQ